MLFKLLESRNHVLRKGTAYILQIPKLMLRAITSESEFLRQPPIVVNSIPKSGTHLLLQIARSIPGSRYYGTFVAQAWSVTLRTRSSKNILFRLNCLVPGEVVGAHLYYNKDIALFLKNLPAVHLFIYRDPRDIVLSEAHYLANMNRWHRLHSIIKKLPNNEMRVRALIEGIPGIYDNIGDRLKRYIGWLNDPFTISVRYEDLVGKNQKQTILYLAKSVCTRANLNCDPVDLAVHMEQAIDPKRSHTFRSGGVEKWKNEMSAENLKLIQHYASKYIKELNYS